MDIVTIDFETYYDRDFSLSKMTTESYIRDPRFEVIGVGVKVNDGPTDWYSGDSPGKFLRSLDYSKRAILCHNTMFDGAILSWHFGIKPRLWLDTMCMAKPFHAVKVGGSLASLTSFYELGKKGDEVVNALGKRRADFTQEDLARYASYCCNDVELTYALFNKLRKRVPVNELMVIDQTLRMYIEPVIELDVPLLEQHLVDVKQRKADLLASVDLPIEDIMSNNKFVKALESLGVPAPTKISPTTGNVTWALSKTDKGMTDLLEYPDDRVQALVATRLGVKSTIEETRTQGLIGVASRGKLPIMLNYFGAHTGRFSGGDKLNLQNLPARGNNTIRRALKPPAGHKIIACDSSQIEARVVAWMAGQTDLLAAFTYGRDVYSEFASEVYGRTITKADKVERFVGKTCILGLGYGMGAEKFRRTLELGMGGVSVKIDMPEAQRIVSLYRSKNHRIAALWNAAGSALTGMMNGGSGRVGPLDYTPDGIVLPNGYTISYPLLRSTGNGFEYIADSREFRKAVKDRVTGESSAVWTKIYGGKVVENMVQALAALAIREQMVALRTRGYKVAFQVHDEIVVVVPDTQAKVAEADIIAVMSTPPVWAPQLPVSCEAGTADNYGDT
jgi:DNA polymerase